MQDPAEVSPDYPIVLEIGMAILAVSGRRRRATEPMADEQLPEG